MRFQTALILVTLTLTTGATYAYVPGRTPNGAIRHWTSGTIAVQFTGPTTVDGQTVHDAALAAMARMTDHRGGVLIIDENAAETFEAPGDQVQRFLYAASVLHCLPAGRTHDHSAATGTVMRPATFEAYALTAGFRSVTILPIENPFFRFYRLSR